MASGSLSSEEPESQKATRLALLINKRQQSNMRVCDNARRGKHPAAARVQLFEKKKARQLGARFRVTPLRGVVKSGGEAKGAGQSITSLFCRSRRRRRTLVLFLTPQSARRDGTGAAVTLISSNEHRRTFFVLFFLCFFVFLILFTLSRLIKRRRYSGTRVSRSLADDGGRRRASNRRRNVNQPFRDVITHSARPPSWCTVSVSVFSAISRRPRARLFELFYCSFLGLFSVSFCRSGTREKFFTRRKSSAGNR